MDTLINISLSILMYAGILFVSAPELISVWVQDKTYKIQFHDFS